MAALAYGADDLDGTVLSANAAFVELVQLANEGMTLILVTHEMAFARKVSDRVIFMHQGRVHEMGSPEALFGQPQTAVGFVLALLCTAAANLLFFRLLGRLGASRAVTVTFMIPVFGSLWGALFLDEAVTGAMVLGGAVILLGTALATGLLRAPAATR